VDNKSTIAVLVVGGSHTGKTTVQRIITNALKAAGIEPVLGENAQQEMETTCQEEGFLEIAAKEVVKVSDVMVEEIHLPSDTVYGQKDPRPVVSFRGYAHSAGFKLIPVYKDKS